MRVRLPTAYIAEELMEKGYGPDDNKLRVGIFGAEPWSNQMREDIENKLGIIACDIYGLSEVLGPGVSCNCIYRNGLHIPEDHFIPEIIDPETGKFCLKEKRRACIYHFDKEGLPLIRYRTETYQPWITAFVNAEGLL